ncbi:exo-alpha-sialidase [Bremerella sp. JC817]|uniref:WD40/YVTN/BNR-like repeat-containing protein n=1 Tax=Bremerella sp. JC817 TaxID=3231756 RepID=UPI0034590A0C
MADRVVLCIGTKKGLFVAEASKSRGRFELRGPFGSGVAVYSALIDTRKSPRLFASSCNAWFGMKLLTSTDLGKKFKETKSAPAFPGKDGRSLANIWALEAGPGSKDLYAGVEPAALFHSEDGGNSWEMISGISNHKHSKDWHPGAGGLCLHTIVRDGDRIHLGISTGGHYLSEDGGKTFDAANDGVGAGFVPNPYPEFGQCVHKIARHPAAPGRLYMQNHGGWPDRPGIGVLRSDDYGHTWESIAEGLPSDFGFPIVVHPHDPETIYVVPLEPSTRTCPEGKPAVWRSTNGGRKWKKLTKGLPKKDGFFTVLRDAMTIDSCDSPAVYFGTTTGQLWMGNEGGDGWTCLFESLPPINCVKAAVI